MNLRLPALACSFLLFAAACGDSTVSDDSSSASNDPGTAAWELVPTDRVAEECGLDPDLLRAADAELGSAYTVVRYGKLCHEYYPEGSDETSEVFSATKTFSAAVTGMVMWETRDLERSGRKTGPVTVNDRVDHWLDSFTFNADAHVGHVLGMVGFNEDLSYPNRMYIYDAAGDREINRLSDVLNTAIAQDTERLGADLEQFTQRFVFEKLGMRASSWTGGGRDKFFAFSWASTARDMARIGLLLLNDGVWNGERLLSSDYVYETTHPSHEDAETRYGYLTWLSSRANTEPFGTCMPAALWDSYPHGDLSDSPDCGYPAGMSCAQEYDVGAWSALGLFGQHIQGHPGLDLVITAKDTGDALRPVGLWEAVRPAVVAMDETYAGDDAAFCAAYSQNAYAPDWQGLQ